MDPRDILERIPAVDSISDLHQLRLELLGKTGVISLALKGLGSMNPEDRKIESVRLNRIKIEVQEALATKQQALQEQQWQQQVIQESQDTTLPAPGVQAMGRLHPIMQMMSEVITIFSSMGFSVRRGPDVEWAWYNFDALNVPVWHPARADQDTFYLRSNSEGSVPFVCPHPARVLRTQTSPVQIRTLMHQGAPLRMISPGRVYRSDHDRTHTPMFHQVEALVVEEGVTMAHLKGVITYFLQQLLGEDAKIRLRPSFFPFTEPSAEVDVAWGQQQDWLEVLGCGMVHPHVFSACGLPAYWPGFALGMGLERLAMIKYNITDIRLLYLNDQRWLDRYGFSPVMAGF